MKNAYLEAGRIVNTHGVEGEVKLEPWSNTPEFLLDFSTVYIGGRAVRVLRARVHKSCVLLKLEGVDTLDQANALRGSVVSVDRADARLPTGHVFLQDIIGMQAVDDETGAVIGPVKDVLELPAGHVYVIDGGREILVPAVDAFVRGLDADAGILRVRLIEGM